MIEARRRRGQQKMRKLDDITNSVDMRMSRLQETVKDREASVLQFVEVTRVGHDLATEQQQMLSIVLALY